MATGQNSNNKITWKGGKSLLESMFSGKTLSEIKSMSKEEKLSSLPAHKEISAKRDSKISTKRTSLEVPPKTFVKPDTNSLLASHPKTPKTAPVIRQRVARPDNLVKRESLNVQKPATTYNGDSSNNSNTLLKSLKLPVDVSTKFVSGTVDYSFPSGPNYGFDGTVYAVTIQSDGKILIGGDFGYYYFDGDSYYAPYLIRLNADGTVDGSLNTDNLNGYVNTIVVQPDGKILLGGNFNYYDYDGSNPNRIIRINSDGSPDYSFVIGNGFDNEVNSIVLQPDGKILVGGYFGSYNNNTANDLIRLNSNGSIDSSFVYGDGNVSFDGVVYVIKLQSDGKILVGGDFNNYANVSANHLIRLNSNGTRDTSFVVGNGVSGYVNTIDLQSNGKIIVGGNFYDNGYYDNNPCNSIIRLNTDGTLDSVFGYGVYGEVTIVKVQPDDKILVGGDFGTFLPDYNSYYSISADELIRYNADTTFDYGFYYHELLNSSPWDIQLLSDGKILIGGEFDNSGVEFPLNYFGRLNNTIPTYKYVYLVVNDFGFNSTSFSVGSNLPLTTNDNGKTVKIKNLNNPSIIEVGSLIIEDTNYFPYATPDYELVEVYDDYGYNSAYESNYKYVRAESLLDGNWDNFWVSNLYNVGDIFFINQSFNYFGYGEGFTVNSCFRITDDSGSYTPFYSPVPYLPYETCEECVQANGVVYVGVSPDTMYSENFLSHQYFNTNDEEYPAVIIPTAPTEILFVVDSPSFYNVEDNVNIGKVYSTKEYNTYFGDIGLNVTDAYNDKGSGQLDFTFNSEFIDTESVGFDDWVFNTKQQSDGKILVVGNFNQYNGFDIPSGEGFVRLNTDGTIDNNFSFDFNNFNTYGNTVETLSDGSVLIGGGLNYGGLHNPSEWVNQTDGDSTVTREDKHWTLVGTNDSQSNGWSYVKRQFFEYGTLYINYDWFTDDGLNYDWPFYYVSTDEPVGGENIVFDDNIFVGSNSQTGQVNINYEPGDWVSIGVYSTDSEGGPGFLRISEYTGLVKVNQDGTPDTTFNHNVFENGGFNSDVYTIKSKPDGKILVGGNFNQFNGNNVDGFVQLNSDGTLDFDFYDTKVLFDGNIYTITLQPDGKILVGGNFGELYDPTTDDVYVTGNLVRLNSNGSLDFTFNSDGNPTTYSDSTPFSGVTAQYIRWVITGTKDVVTTTQASELYLTLNGQQLGFDYGVVTCTNPSGTNPSGEEPIKLVDDNTDTKWTDTSFSANGQSVIVIDNGSPINFDGYKYYTGNDIPGRDPITWTLAISDDGLNWSTISTVTNATITDDRKTSTEIFPVTTPTDFGGSMYFDGTSFVSVNTTDGVWNLSDNDLTFEWFQKFEGTQLTKPTVFSYSDTYLSVYFYDGEIKIYVNGDVYNYGLDENISDKWWHFAITRESDTWRVFQNGYQLGSFTNSIVYGSGASPLLIGTASNYLKEPNNSGQGSFTGYITNFRVINGYAIYTSDFTPPTEPLNPNYTPGNDVLSLLVSNEADFILDSSDDNIPTSNSGNLFIGFNDYITDIQLESDGHILVGGDFNYYNDNYVGNGLIRLNSDGSWNTDLNINDGFDGSVQTIAIQPDGKILVGGFFEYYYAYGGWNSYGIIRLNPNGTPDTRFIPIIYGDGFSNPILKIELTEDGKSIVSGWANYYNSSGNIQIGSGGCVVRLYTSDNFKYTEFDTCNGDTAILNLPYNSTIHTLTNFWSGNEHNDYHVVTLPPDFVVNFLGTDYQSVNISSNAYLTFGNGGDPSNCCFTIPYEIPSSVGLPGIFVSIENMEGQLYNLYSGYTDDGNTLIIKYEGSYHRYQSDIPNLVIDYIFYKDNPYQIDVVIEENSLYSNLDPISGVNDGVNGNFLASFNATPKTAWRITDSSTIVPLSYNEIETGNDVLVGDINKTPSVCGTVLTETTGYTISSGSIYFSGDDYIYSESNSDWELGTSDFTIEWFQYRETSVNSPRLFTIGGYDSGGAAIAVSFEGSSFTLWLNGSSYDFGDLYDFESWTHFAITRTNNLIRVFKNGVEVFSENSGTPIVFTGLISYDGQNLEIGRDTSVAGTTQYVGSLTNFRWTKGEALYTSNFDVPNQPLTDLNDNVKLLLLCAVAGNPLFDTTGNHDVSSGGEGPIDFNSSTAPFQYGYVLYNSNGINHYKTCIHCLVETPYNVISYVRDGVKPDYVKRFTLSKSDIDYILENGPIFTDNMATIPGTECYEILSYYK